MVFKNSGEMMGFGGVVVIGKDGKIAYTELVPEITQEPDYDKAIAAVK